jgi:hypothetical protein
VLNKLIMIFEDQNTTTDGSKHIIMSIDIGVRNMGMYLVKTQSNSNSIIII